MSRATQAILQVPIFDDPGLNKLARWVREEVDRVARNAVEPTAVRLTVRYEAPLRPRQGMLVAADGTTWDPGDGMGVYEFDGTDYLRLATTDLTAAGTGATKLLRFYNPNGEVGSISTSGTATTYNTASDWRLKVNPVPLSAELDIPATIMSAQVVAFTWKGSRQRDYGFLAQQLVAVVPRAVTVGSEKAADGAFTPWMVDYSKLTPYLWAHNQLLQTKIEALESRLQQLEQHFNVKE